MAGLDGFDGDDYNNQQPAPRRPRATVLLPIIMVACVASAWPSIDVKFPDTMDIVLSATNTPQVVVEANANIVATENEHPSLTRKQKVELSVTVLILNSYEGG